MHHHIMKDRLVPDPCEVCALEKELEYSMGIGCGLEPRRYCSETTRWSLRPLTGVRGRLMSWHGRRLVQRGMGEKPLFFSDGSEATFCTTSDDALHVHPRKRIFLPVSTRENNILFAPCSLLLARRSHPFKVLGSMGPKDGFH